MMTRTKKILFVTAIIVGGIRLGLVETYPSVVRFRGDKDRADNVYKGIHALTGADIAEVAYFAASESPGSLEHPVHRRLGIDSHLRVISILLLEIGPP